MRKWQLASSPVSQAQPEVWLELTDEHNLHAKTRGAYHEKAPVRRSRVLSLVFGTVALAAPANAYTFSQPNQNQGNNS